MTNVFRVMANIYLGLYKTSIWEQSLLLECIHNTYLFITILRNKQKNKRKISEIQNCEEQIHINKNSTILTMNQRMNKK